MCAYVTFSVAFYGQFPVSRGVTPKVALFVTLEVVLDQNVYIPPI